jgi:hypothetical protein
MSDLWASRWENLIAFYERLGTPSPYDGSESILKSMSEQMISLIQELRQIVPEEFEPSRERTILTLRGANSNQIFFIGCDRNDNAFNVWYEDARDPVDRYEYRVTVSADHVFETIKLLREQFINR